MNGLYLVKFDMSP